MQYLETNTHIAEPVWRGVSYRPGETHSFDAARTYLVRLPRGDHLFHRRQMTSSGASRGVPLQNAAVRVRLRMQPGDAAARALVLHGRAHARRVHVCLFAQAPRVCSVRTQVLSLEGAERGA